MYLTLNAFLIFLTCLYAQNKALADSLEIIYSKGEYREQDKLLLLKEIAENQTDAERKLAYSIEYIQTAQQVDSSESVIWGYVEKGHAFRLKGNLGDALESYLYAAELAHTKSLKLTVGKINITIADVYSVMGNHDNSIKYYKSALSILRMVNDSVSIATALLNAGDEYIHHKEYDSALVNFEESGRIFSKIKYQIGTAYNLGNIGMVYAEQGKNAQAEAKINDAILILEKLEDYSPISVYLTYMADIYARQNDFDTAFGYGNRSLQLATSHGLKEQISDANLKLSELYAKRGDSTSSYRYYKNYITYRDSVKNIKEVERMADLRTNYEVSQKQTEVDLLNQQKRNQQIILGFSALLLVSLFWYYRTISKEKKRSEALLLNILPAETAHELKKNGTVKAKKYESVSVLFTDFKGFTSYSEKLSPEALVETIGFYFSKFDEIIEKHGLEKIKTIGDAYMCAGGLHANDKNHAQRMVMAGLEIAAFVEETKNDITAVERSFDIRLGINTGPVVAGVVGTKKFAYDIWGDTVNVASRMESLSEPGKINISETTYALVKDSWACEYRGEIEVKNRGALKMYFVMA